MRMYYHVIVVLSLGLLTFWTLQGSYVISAGAEAQTLGRAAESSGCLACHDGIEPIRDPQSEMMQQIFRLGKMRGDPAGCVICHGGDPRATSKEDAHKGNAFYADPGSPWINGSTCGQCHPELVKAQWNSLMMTEAGKIQGAAWAFGSLEGYDHKWGNFDAANPPDGQKRLGTADYNAYMKRLEAAEPQVFPHNMTALPKAPTDLSRLTDHPEEAVFTYMRSECQRCHLAVPGRQKRGDYRGMGCSACHIPYGNEGLYEGDDKEPSEAREDLNLDGTVDLRTIMKGPEPGARVLLNGEWVPARKDGETYIAELSDEPTRVEFKDGAWRIAEEAAGEPHEPAPGGEAHLRREEPVDGQVHDR